MHDFVQVCPRAPLFGSVESKPRNGIAGWCLETAWLPLGNACPNRGRVGDQGESVQGREERQRFQAYESVRGIAGHRWQEGCHNRQSGPGGVGGWRPDL